MKLLVILILGWAPFLHGSFINPITDVCWECLFPITISGVNVTPNTEDFTKYNQRTCYCAGTPPKVGIPLTFWEPLRMVEVTREAYKLIGLGGISLSKASVKNRGSVGLIDATSTQNSFYHVHWYQYPILSILKLFTDFLCLEKSEIDLAYMSEYDPTWNDPNLSIILDPEAGLFANPLAQLSCIADCASSNLNIVNDALFWCAGCQGSVYPFTGTISHHASALQASSLLVHRIIAKMHRCGFTKGFKETDFCEASYMPIIKKSLYKTQLTYPVPQTKGPCHPLGKSDVLWGLGKSFPVRGEEFVYLLWVKKQCCLDAVKPAATANVGVQ